MILDMEQERSSECTEAPKVGVKVCVPQIMEQIVEVGQSNVTSTHCQSQIGVETAEVVDIVFLVSVQCTVEPPEFCGWISVQLSLRIEFLKVTVNAPFLGVEPRFWSTQDFYPGPEF